MEFQFAFASISARCLLIFSVLHQLRKSRRLSSARIVGVEGVFVFVVDCDGVFDFGFMPTKRRDLLHSHGATYLTR